jgi:hypothetical protein
MSRYEGLFKAAKSTGVLDGLTPVSASKLALLRELYPEAPEDYLDFLSELGFGLLGAGAYMIYEGLLTPDEIYDPETADALGNILLFGDDLQGYCAGFYPEADWAVFEVEPTDMSVNMVGKTFEEFVIETIGNLLPKGWPGRA